MRPRQQQPLLVLRQPRAAPRIVRRGRRADQRVRQGRARQARRLRLELELGRRRPHDRQDDRRRRLLLGRGWARPVIGPRVGCSASGSVADLPATFYDRHDSTPRRLAGHHRGAGPHLLEDPAARRRGDLLLARGRALLADERRGLRHRGRRAAHARDARRGRRLHHRGEPLLADGHPRLGGPADQGDLGVRAADDLRALRLRLRPRRRAQAAGVQRRHADRPARVGRRAVALGQGRLRRGRRPVEPAARDARRALARARSGRSPARRPAAPAAHERRAVRRGLHDDRLHGRGGARREPHVRAHADREPRPHRGRGLRRPVRQPGPHGVQALSVGVDDARGVQRAGPRAHGRPARPDAVDRADLEDALVQQGHPAGAAPPLSGEPARPAGLVRRRAARRASTRSCASRCSPARAPTPPS